MRAMTHMQAHSGAMIPFFLQLQDVWLHQECCHTHLSLKVPLKWNLLWYRDLSLQVLVYHQKHLIRQRLRLSTQHQVDLGLRHMQTQICSLLSLARDSCLNAHYRGGRPLHCQIPTGRLHHLRGHRLRGPDLLLIEDNGCFNLMGFNVDLCSVS